MRRHWQLAAFVAAALGMALPAAAQTAGGGGGGGGGGSSPGIGRQGESETGVGVPADAPVDNRTLQPVQIGTGEAGAESQSASAAGPGAGNTAYTDLSQNETGTGMQGTGAGATASGAKISNKLRDGLEQLHADDQFEVQSGQLAQENASSSDVKAFGQRMVTDHSQNDQQLTGMAQTLGVNLEGNAYQKEMKDAEKTAKKFQGKTGSAFDQSYIDAMVKDHQTDAKDVKKLADQARKDNQGELASFLDQTESTIQSHLDQAKQLQSSVKSASSEKSTTTGTGTGNQ